MRWCALGQREQACARLRPSSESDTELCGSDSAAHGKRHLFEPRACWDQGAIRLDVYVLRMRLAARLCSRHSGTQTALIRAASARFLLSGGTPYGATFLAL
jgi:hypothetical protein